MTATFILSFDCEGKWGVADHLGPAHHRTLTDDRLKWAYRSIIDLLDRFEIPATFAFVGAFTWNRETADIERLREFGNAVPEYLGPALQDLAKGGEGWFGDWAVDLVPSVHEIALHGATHVPWGAIDEATARQEIELLDAMPRVSAATTYVFPRNQVNHTGVLSTIGIKAWRECRSMTAARSLLSEFNVFSAPDYPGQSIPAGRFVNWRSGVRRLVPPVLSRHRAKRMLARAAATRGIVHYWTHPENIASAPSTLHVLEGILAEVKKASDRGLVRTLRQADYATEQRLIGELRNAPPRTG